MLTTKFTLKNKVLCIQPFGCPTVAKSRALEAADRPGFESCLVIYNLFVSGQGSLTS